MVEDFDKVESVYNEGLLQIQRLNNSYQRCNYYSCNGLLVKWRWELDVIWRELSFDASKLDKVLDKVKRYSFLFSELDKSINRSFMFGKLIGSWGNCYKLLNDKEVLLRSLQHSAGKGGKYQDEDARSIED